MNDEILFNTMLSDYPDVLNVNQVCIILGIGKKLAYYILKDNKIAYLKVGRSYKIPKVNLIQYLIHDDQHEH